MVKINVCFCIDEGYLHQLGAVLLSLVESNRQNDVDIYVISKGVDKQSKARLARTINNVQKFSISFIDSQDNLVNKLEAGGHISSAAYIRWEIPKLLANLDKVIYLDSDLVIIDDLTGFWNIEIEDNYVAAVENPFFSRYEELSMKPEFGYFNAGVMLMNLRHWREDDIRNKSVTFLSNNKAACLNFDQCALNAVFEGKWKRVALRWNLQTKHLTRKRELPSLKKEINSAYKLPGIIHYSSSSKPWNLLDPHPKASIYKNYEKQFGKQLKSYSFVQRLRAFMKFCYRRVWYMYQIN